MPVEPTAVPFLQLPADLVERVIARLSKAQIFDLSSELRKAVTAQPAPVASDPAAFEPLGHVSVDSGQLVLVDPCYLDSRWQHKEFEDIRIYRHKETGATLQFRKDFANYEDPIRAWGNQTMNALNATGAWEAVKQAVAPGLNYDACSRTTLNKQGGGQVDGVAVAVATGYGDGCYPVSGRRDATGRIMQVLIDFGEDDHA